MDEHPKIKPGTVCYLKGLTEAHVEFNGRVVTAVKKEFERNYFSGYWLVAAEWLPRVEDGWYADEKHLLPISDPWEVPEFSELLVTAV